jgi:cholesterol oxidase
MKTFDVIVIGSGFGGAVAACRLADSGARVLVLERGRRWVQDEYPREPKDAWIYEHTNPEKYNGWLDVRFYRGMSVVQGAGVGGGSQCYSSVLLKANADCFDQGWVPELTYQELLPYYEKVSQMLSVTPIPDSQYTYRHKLLHQTAYKLGMGQRFSSVPLALSFDPEWNYNLDDPFDLKHSRRFVNPQGIEQGTCIHLGDCDIGCKAKAKNTLDLNYIAKAEHNGAEVRPLHIVRSIEPCESGYKVIFDRIHEEKLIRGEEFASMRAIMKELKYLARATNAAIIILHHTSEAVLGTPCQPRSALQGKVAQLPALICTLGVVGTSMAVAPVKNRYGRADANANLNCWLSFNPEFMFMSDIPENGG